MINILPNGISVNIKDIRIFRGTLMVSTCRDYF